MPSELYPLSPAEPSLLGAPVYADRVGGVHRKRTAAAAKSLQSCPILCDPTDGSPQGSPVPGIRKRTRYSFLTHEKPFRGKQLHL